MGYPRKPLFQYIKIGYAGGLLDGTRQYLQINIPLKKNLLFKDRRENVVR